MNYPILPYDKALEQILEHGFTRTNKRTGIETLHFPGIFCKYDLTDKFPLLTGRKIWPKAIFAELAWIVSGSTNVYDLNQLGSHIWDAWADSDFEERYSLVDGSLGPIYGFQLRHFNGHYGNGDKSAIDYGKGGIDQYRNMIEEAQNDPSSRRLLFSLWNPAQEHMMKLPPCHYTYQITIDDDKRLTGSLTQRSADFPVGVPANIQFYSTLTKLLAHHLGCTATHFMHYCVDAHIYKDQVPAVIKYLETSKNPCPDLEIDWSKFDIYNIDPDIFKIQNYKPQPKIEIPVAI